MFLNGEQIKSRLNIDNRISLTDNFDEKLIITPILQYEDQIKDDSVSVDLRLGNNFVLFNRFNISHTDPASDEYYNRKYTVNYELQIGQSLILHPGQFFLGETLEWVKMPYNLCGLISAKSSEARDGLQVETANLIHPRFSGTITLELKNNGEVPLTLYPGLQIAQLSLIPIQFITKATPISKGTFPYQFGPSVSKKQKKDLEKIKKFRELFL